MSANLISEIPRFGHQRTIVSTESKKTSFSIFLRRSNLNFLYRTLYSPLKSSFFL